MYSYQLPLRKQAIKYYCIEHDRSCDLGQIWLTELRTLEKSYNYLWFYRDIN